MVQNAYSVRILKRHFSASGRGVAASGARSGTVELMQLEMFVAVVEEGSVRAAADRVLRTQPAVSMALRKLEDEVGIPLFLRADGHRLLSEAGEMFYHYARNLLDLRGEAVCALAELGSCQVDQRKAAQFSGPQRPVHVSRIACKRQVSKPKSNRATNVFPR